MGVYRRNDSGVYWYDFTVDGTRHRGSSGTKKLTEARAVEAALIVKAKEQGSDAVRPVRALILRDLAGRFLEWVQSSRLEENSKRYYQRGWKLISSTQLAGMQISRITSDDIEMLHYGMAEEVNGHANRGRGRIDRKRAAPDLGTGWHRCEVPHKRSLFQSKDEPEGSEG